ncbi:MAG: cysteine--tRNA ligase [Candidatus Hatepunaea meridiana]|nr:cysteine--tRNA ligase [Candidatus Hatepunaea meridiana]
MPFSIYDTRQRRKVPFETIEPGKVKMYTCGPTVYKDATIGNFRTYIFEDLLRRTLKYLGYQVMQVMNITDVDDKTINEAKLTGKPLNEITKPVIEQFFRDIDLLNIERVEYYPLATQHVHEMIELIEKLLRSGNAYRMDDSIYFSITSFPEYGKLSGMKLNKLKCGVRIDADEYEKDDSRDFALWKGWTEDDGDVGWDSPFGRGRPGWHIECSALSRKYLGEEFDLHTGGVDNIFPHHENEIAQSVAATGKSYAQHWMHSAHLMVDGEKMSKSLGNVFTLTDLLNKGNSVRALRYVLMATYYRHQLNFTNEAVSVANSSLKRLDTLYQAAKLASGSGAVRYLIQEKLEITRDDFKSSLTDDLNISEALAALFKLVTNVHQAIGETALNRNEGIAIMDFWMDVDRVLGFLVSKETAFPDDIALLIRERISLRCNRMFEKADRFRDELAKKGFHLEDTSDGTVVIWQGGRKIIK